MGVWADFFGQSAYTMTLAAKLAAQTGATVLLAVGERLPRGRGYRVWVEPAPSALPPEPQAASERAKSDATAARLVERENFMSETPLVEC